MDNHEEKGAANPVGRPTDYRPEYADQLLAYFDPNKPVGADGKRAMPFMSRFAWDIGVTTQTLKNWADAVDANGSPLHPEFFGAYSRCRDLQEFHLSDGALKGDFNPTYAGLTAKNILGWRDKQDTAHTGAEGGPVMFTVVERRAID